MLFLMIGTDKPDGGSDRQRLRQVHIDYWQGLGGKVKLGGPTLTIASPDADVVASVLLIEADSEAEAMNIAQNDPFALEGVFDTVDVKPMRITLGEWKP